MKPTPVHVLPLGDLMEHEESTSCWCVPRIEEVLTNGGVKNFVIVHHAADGRA